MRSSFRSAQIFSLMLLVAFGPATRSQADETQDVPGHVLLNGVYLPAEPYIEGQPKATGLQHPFPKMVSVEANPVTPEKVELGKLLYFDPILSGDNTMSCATCHHPDHGFSDGRKRGMGVGGTGAGPERTGGQDLPRNTPTIWNAAYNHLQYWDGRAKDLEEQASKPITAQIEMNQDPAELVGELGAIPEYVTLFEEAFEDSAGHALTFENVTRAIASFERTLLAFNSRFDRYTQGDSTALNEQEKRGLSAFRSVKTRCFECHRFPTFADDTFRVVGVPASSHDPGRAGVPGQGPDSAFKVPSLRNVALTAPYMHNGHFATLEEVVKFYADGGGRALPNPPDDIDDKIGKFPTTDQEIADLVAFLHALTDTSLMPAPPERVPSGLPVLTVLAKAHPAPPPASAFVGASRPMPSVGTPKPGLAPIELGVNVAQAPSTGAAAATFTVRAGQSIQAAVDRAQPGDRIEVMPGVYHQSVVVDKPDITLAGLKENGTRAILDGEDQLADAVQTSADHFAIEGFAIRNYIGNGVVSNKSSNVSYRDLNISLTGLYGVYPVECVGVLVERCVVSGIADAGIYVGQSRDIVVRDNEVYASVAGIEIENSVNALVENNSSHHNTAGILVFALPNNPSKEGSHCRVANNRMWSNNLPNFGKPGSTVSGISAGVGLVIMAVDHTEVTQNVIEDNGSYAISVLGVGTSTLSPEKKHEIDIEPNPDNTFIHDNTFIGNGTNPSAQFKKDYPDLPPGDLFWDGTGKGNVWQERLDLVVYPETLLKSNGGLHTDVVPFVRHIDETHAPRFARAANPAR